MLAACTKVAAAEPPTIASTHKIFQRCSETPETPHRSRVLSQLPWSSNSTSSALSTSSLESLTKDREEMEEVKSLNNMSQILQNSKHLLLSSYVVTMNSKNIPLLCLQQKATTAFSPFLQKLILPITWSKFWQANFCCRIKFCIIKKSKSLEERRHNLNWRHS